IALGQRGSLMAPEVRDRHIGTTMSQIFTIVQGQLFQSPRIDDWTIIRSNDITAIIDVDGMTDSAIPNEPNSILYLYWPLVDGPLPNPTDLQLVAEYGLNLMKLGHRVLAHCAARINRSSLVNASILHLLNPTWTGQQIVDYIREHRPGALTNQVFLDYILKFK